MYLTDNTTYISFYLKDGKVHVFADAIRSLGTPNYIRFLLGRDGSSMIMEPYHKKEFQSIRVKKDNEQIHHKLCFRCKPFCKLLENTFGWASLYSYRVPGRLILSQRIILFDLTQAAAICTLNEER